MRSLRSFSALLILAVSLSTGCDTGPAGAREPSWFRASLSGEVQSAFEGTGDFVASRDDEHSSARYFRVFSRTTEAGRRDAIWIRWPSAAAPAPGRYPLVPHDTDHGSQRGITLVYSRSSGDNVTTIGRSELYVAREGVVEITRAGDGVLEGTVEFSALQVYRMEGSTVYRYDSRTAPDPRAPVLNAVGSFRAVPFDEDGQVGIPN